MPQIQIRQCQKQECRFRYPWNERDPAAMRCPRCGSPVDVVLEYTSEIERLAQTSAPRNERPPIAALLDNIRSTFNVGSIFRCADGAGFSHLYLCGITPTPDHPKVAKTA